MRSTSNILLTFLLVFVLLGCVFFIISLSMNINEQQYEIEELVKQVETKKEKVEELKYQIERASDPDDIEFKIEIAREKLNYHLPNEIIFYNGRSE